MTEREHDPVESARPSIGGRDTPDALRPDTDREPDKTLPDQETEEPPTPSPEPE
jgi:hypothetical protein